MRMSANPPVPPKTDIFGCKISALPVASHPGVSILVCAPQFSRGARLIGGLFQTQKTRKSLLKTPGVSTNYDFKIFLTDEWWACCVSLIHSRSFFLRAYQKTQNKTDSGGNKSMIYSSKYVVCQFLICFDCKSYLFSNKVFNDA